MQVSPELGNTQDSRAPGLEESEAFKVRVAGWAPSGVLHECTPPTQVGAAGITLSFASTGNRGLARRGSRAMRTPSLPASNHRPQWGIIRTTGDNDGSIQLSHGQLCGASSHTFSPASFLHVSRTLLSLLAAGGKGRGQGLVHQCRHWLQPASGPLTLL